MLRRSPGAVQRPLASLSFHHRFSQAAPQRRRTRTARAAPRRRRCATHGGRGKGGGGGGLRLPVFSLCPLRRGRSRAAAVAASLAAAPGLLCWPLFLSVGAAYALRAHARAHTAAAPALYRSACANRLPWGRAAVARQSSVVEQRRWGGRPLPIGGVGSVRFFSRSLPFRPRAAAAATALRGSSADCRFQADRDGPSPWLSALCACSTATGSVPASAICTTAAANGAGRWTPALPVTLVKARAASYGCIPPGHCTFCPLSLLFGWSFRPTGSFGGAGISHKE